MYCTLPTRRPWHQRLNQPAYRAISADYTYQRMFRGQTLGDRQLAALKPVKSRLQLLKNLTPARYASDNVNIPDEIKRYRPELQRAYLLELQKRSETN
ncbi:hypothetical protein NG799_29070 [Laspinema sp. D1]|uniref:Uncharacterized protein n=1 Tax=Laspinema palackyanum D2a TaxID=2953684 RepID=A0ABT2N046_9CYAN|nr:hypothetical protein [Laspinema sp. D2a]